MWVGGVGRWFSGVGGWYWLLVWVQSVFLIPGLLVWVVGVGCWRGIAKFRRCDHHPCEVLQFNQCSHLQEVGFSLSFFVLSLWTAVGVGYWCGVLVWVVGVGCWRGISKLRRCVHHPRGILQFQSMF